MVLHQVEKMFTISSLHEIESLAKESQIFPLTAEDYCKLTLRIPADLIRIIERAEGKFLEFRADAVSQLAAHNVFREGEIVQFLGSEDAEFTFLVKLFGDFALQVWEDLQLGTIYGIRLVKHGIYWLNVTAELVQKVASEPLPGKSRAESYVFLRLIEVPNPFIFLIECLARTQVCNRISLVFEIVSEEKAYISSIGQDFNLTSLQDTEIVTQTIHVFSIQSIDTIEIPTRQNLVFSISCVDEVGIV